MECHVAYALWIEWLIFVAYKFVDETYSKRTHLKNNNRVLYITFQNSDNKFVSNISNLLQHVKC